MALPKIIEKFKDYLPLIGGKITGKLMFNCGLILSTNDDNAKETWFTAGDDWGQGGLLTLFHKDSPSIAAGGFILSATNDGGVTNKGLLGMPDGTLTWCGNDVATLKEYGDSSGWRVVKFSNGWLVMACKVSIPSVAASKGKSVTVTLPFDVGGNNYDIFITQASDASYFGQLAFANSYRTSTNFIINAWNNGAGTSGVATLSVLFMAHTVS